MIYPKTHAAKNTVILNLAPFAHSRRIPLREVLHEPLHPGERYRLPLRGGGDALGQPAPANDLRHRFVAPGQDHPKHQHAHPGQVPDLRPQRDLLWVPGRGLPGWRPFRRGSGMLAGRATLPEREIVP
jgi:hypothetical protein